MIKSVKNTIDNQRSAAIVPLFCKNTACSSLPRPFLNVSNASSLGGGVPVQDSEDLLRTLSPSTP